MTTAQILKAVIFRELHSSSSILILPNAWDAASARIYEAAGFSAIGTTSAGVANSLGYPDGQRAPFEEALFVVRRIVHSVQIPVTMDIEAGYSVNSAAETVETVQKAMEAGVVGINLEDVGFGEPALVDLGLQIEKIRAIRAFAEKTGVPIFINARTDAFHLLGLDMDTKFQLAIERVNAYHHAGADCMFIPFVTDELVISNLVQAANGPLNILAMPGSPSAAQLERLGVGRVSVGSGPHRATLALLRRISHEMLEKGTFHSFMDQTIPYDEVNKLFSHEQ